MRKGPLAVLFGIVFVDLLGFGIVIPILPYYAQAYGASGLEVGLLMACYSGMQFLFSPLWGALSDRHGRRPVLILSIAGAALAMLGLGFAPSLAWLFVGRLAAGMFGANISTAYAYVADVTDEANRAKGMGIVGAGFGLGFIFGPAIGGILSRYGYDAPMFAGAALAGLNTLFALWKLPEPPLSAAQRAKNRTRRPGIAEAVTLLRRGKSGLPVVLFFGVTFAVVQMEVAYALFLKARFGFDAHEAGLLLACTGLIMVIMQGGLIGRLVSRFGEERLVPFGAAMGALALAGFGFSYQILWSGLALGVMAVGQGMLHPSLSSLASRGARADQRGLTLGIFHSASSLARVLGPLPAGLLFDRVAPGAPFLVSALILAGVSALSATRLSPRKT
ncbi:MAG: MFS transporter [Bdellovibrionales bacterium]|nr:MFS transporter [Bdellovibrionales bacterium]